MVDVYTHLRNASIFKKLEEKYPEAAQTISSGESRYESVLMCIVLLSTNENLLQDDAAALHSLASLLASAPVDPDVYGIVTLPMLLECWNHPQLPLIDDAFYGKAPFLQNPAVSPFFRIIAEKPAIFQRINDKVDTLQTDVDWLKRLFLVLLVQSDVPLNEAIHATLELEEAAVGDTNQHILDFHQVNFDNRSALRRFYAYLARFEVPAHYFITPRYFVADVALPDSVTISPFEMVAMGALLSFSDRDLAALIRRFVVGRHDRPEAIAAIATHGSFHRNLAYVRSIFAHFSKSGQTKFIKICRESLMFHEFNSTNVVAFFNAMSPFLAPQQAKAHYTICANLVYLGTYLKTLNYDDSMALVCNVMSLIQLLLSKDTPAYNYNVSPSRNFIQPFSVDDYLGLGFLLFDLPNVLIDRYKIQRDNIAQTRAHAIQSFDEAHRRTMPRIARPFLRANGANNDEIRALLENTTSLPMLQRLLAEAVLPVTATPEDSDFDPDASAAASDSSSDEDEAAAAIQPPRQRRRLNEPVQNALELAQIPNPAPAVHRGAQGPPARALAVQGPRNEVQPFRPAGAAHVRAYVQLLNDQRLEVDITSAVSAALGQFDSRTFLRILPLAGLAVPTTTARLQVVGVWASGNGTGIGTLSRLPGSPFIQGILFGLIPCIVYFRGGAVTLYIPLDRATLLLLGYDHDERSLDVQTLLAIQAPTQAQLNANYTAVVVNFGAHCEPNPDLLVEVMLLWIRLNAVNIDAFTTLINRDQFDAIAVEAADAFQFLSRSAVAFFSSGDDGRLFQLLERVSVIPRLTLHHRFVRQFQDIVNTVPFLKQVNDLRLENTDLRSDVVYHRKMLDQAHNTITQCDDRLLQMNSLLDRAMLLHQPNQPLQPVQQLLLPAPDLDQPAPVLDQPIHPIQPAQVELDDDLLPFFAPAQDVNHDWMEIAD